MKKSLAELFDELSVTNIKIYFLVDKVESEAGTVFDAKKLQKLNRYRAKLMNAISEEFKQEGRIKV